MSRLEPAAKESPPESEMTIAQIDEPTLQRPLRLWPGVVAAVLLLLVRFGVPVVAPGFEGFGVATIGGFVGVLMIVVWWVFLSRAPRSERWAAIVLMITATVATWRINHESMGLMWCVSYAVRSHWRRTSLLRGCRQFPWLEPGSR